MLLDPRGGVMFPRIRKAVVAGVTAGVAAAIALLAKSGWSLDQATVSQAVGAFVAAAAVAAWATWRVPNAKV
jgi:ABC-type transport system involved in cytochrome bd biosynthesis fused ATPase/permease subunit